MTARRSLVTRQTSNVYRRIDWFPRHPSWEGPGAGGHWPGGAVRLRMRAKRHGQCAHVLRAVEQSHSRQAYAGSGCEALADGPQRQPSHDRLAVHHRRRENQTTKALPEH